MERLLELARRRATIVFTAASISAAAGLILVSRAAFDTNILRLLPRGSAPTQDLQAFLHDFGSLDRLYLVFRSTDPISEHTDLIDAYVDGLRRSAEISSVDSRLFETGKDWSYLADRVLLLMDPMEASKALGRLRPPELPEEINRARDRLALPSPAMKELVQRDPIGLLGLLRDRLGREKGLLAFDPSQEGYVSRDGRTRLVIVKPAGAPFDASFCRTLFARLASVESRARAWTGSVDERQPVAIEAAGAYRASIETERVIRREGMTNAAGSLLLLLVVMLVLFRTPLMLLYGSVPLALAALLTVGVNGLARRALSPATSGSAGMLFGLGIDGVVLLYMRYLEERQRGVPGAEAIRRLAGTASSVALAQLTTAATFLALVVVDFPALEDLGSLVGIGIVLCCAWTLLLLPALLSLPTRRLGRGISTTWLGDFVIRRSKAIVWTALAATVLAVTAAPRLRIDTRLERLQAHTPGTRVERELAEQFSLPTDVLLVLNDNERLEPLLDADVRLSASLAGSHPDLIASGPSLLFPPERAQAAVASRIQASGLAAADVAAQIRAAGAAAGFRRGTFDPFVARLPVLLDPAQRITYDGLMAHGLGFILSRFIARHEGGYAAVTYLYPRRAVDLDALAHVIRSVDPQFRLTGIPVVNRDLSRQALPQFARGIIVGTILVAALIYLVFRSIRFTVLALVPTAAGFVWSAALLAVARVPMDLFSLFAAVVCIGIAVDYGIYVLYRYAEEQGHDMRDVLTRTGSAIIIACATALIGFGSLMTSSYEPLRRFGLVSVVTLACCLAASLLLLPALVLQLNDGAAHREHSGQSPRRWA